MSILKDNKILSAAEKKIEDNLLPDVRADYMKIVVSGMKVGLKDGESGILASIKNSKDPINDCAVGAVNLVLMLRKASRGTMPEKAMVPASMTLMLKALEFANKAGLIKVGADELNKATRIWANHILKTSGVTPQILTKIGSKVQSVVNDPIAMNEIALRAGTAKYTKGSAPSGIVAENKNK